LQYNDYLANALLEQRASIAPADCGAVYFAAMTGATATLKTLLDRHAEVPLTSRDGILSQTPLQAAARAAQTGTAIMLVERGAANIEEAMPKKPLSAQEIFYFAQYGHVVLATGGETPLIIAKQTDHLDTVEQLIKHGARE
jgi:ankyrin repeat protein